MVGDPRLLILLPMETRQVAPDNTVVLTLKTGNQTYVAPYSTDNRSMQILGVKGQLISSQSLLHIINAY